MKIIATVSSILTVFFVLTISAVHAGPVIVGNAAGFLENQYVAMWVQRTELFGKCLESSTVCNLTPAEVTTLQKISQAASQWRAFEFYRAAEFNVQAQGLVHPASVSFVAFTQKPGRIVFDQDAMYGPQFKWELDKRFYLLATIAAEQAGLTKAQAEPVIGKMVGFWQLRWMKLDLGILGHQELQVWVQQNQTGSMLLFDQAKTFDLAPLVREKLKCQSGGPSKGVVVTAPFWSAYAQSSDALNATLAGSVQPICDGPSEPPMNFEMELVFKYQDRHWQFQPSFVKLHLSALGFRTRRPGPLH